MSTDTEVRIRGLRALVEAGHSGGRKIYHLDVARAFRLYEMAETSLGR